MTTTAASPGTLPVYKRAEIPEQLKHLRTATELKADRMKPAAGQQPVALVRVYRRGHGWGDFPLYDPTGAAKMRPLSAKQQAAKTARRTCPRCGDIRKNVVYGQCSACDVKDHEARLALQARTCWKCRRVSAAALPREQESRCAPCWVRWRLQKQSEEERRVVWARTCPGHPGHDCTVQTASDAEIAAERAAGTWGGPRRCQPCDEAFDLWQEDLRRSAADAEQQAQERRQQQVRELVAWAQEVLDDPDTVVLDTETTGLEDDARIVDLAVLTVAGEALLNTLINPGEAIPAEATSIHGITDDHVASAPPFVGVLEQLGTVLRGRRCLIYNRSYDVARLRHELTVHYRQAGHTDPEAAAAAWLDGMRFEDAMIPYSNWFGDWSDYWGNYTWQPLYGGDHRAVSDCRAVVDRLREMAGGGETG
ncbi:3'-5' exonuclease [Streptomyces scabiei]|uniref:3'-5' exonuclease n=1 Tax=Streptomyces scabiei TaxID=1930 RepID=UPI00068DBF3C|nr:3'-5' exonuclease [Streptomyces scabiei]